MKVVKADPPKKITKWQPLLDALADNPPGTWLKIEMMAINGGGFDAENKRNSVLTAMRRRGIKVRTKLDHLHVYVRSVVPRKSHAIE